jgi:hypothetical protein
VRRTYFSLLFIFVFTANGFAQLPVDTLQLQPADTLPANDTPTHSPVNRQVSKRPATDSGWAVIHAVNPASPGFIQLVLKHHPYFAFGTKPMAQDLPGIRKVIGKEWLFYSLLFLVIAFATLKRMFPKYFNDLFRLFFRTTLKQKQVREQLMQTPLPSLLLNGFFVLCGAFYISFQVKHYSPDAADGFWTIFFYAGITLSVIYFLKFIGLKISGWLFGMQEAADAYVFIVFIINKMIGIFLIPFLFVLAFSTGIIYTVGLTLSWFLIGGLLAYRLILTWGTIRSQARVSPFHFFLYLLAFEVTPLLLVYKALLLYFSQTA